MLDVIYEAVDDLPPGRLAKIEESRGRIRVRLDKHAPLSDVVRQLNIEAAQVMSSAHWFQLWGEEIISRDTPSCPFRTQYVLKENAPHGVGVAEGRGTVRYYISAGLTIAEFAAFMIQAAKELLAGGCWFQLYAGEIIDTSPEPMSKV
jgi:hypothetical protein